MRDQGIEAVALLQGGVYVIGLVGVLAAAGGVAVALMLKGRRKSPSEKERERRLMVNTVGRICDGSLVEITDYRDASGRLVRHLHYSYVVGGVEYAAAQDISALRSLVQQEKCSEGVPTSVKYDPQNPSNSIVICELWSGLR